jgi:hypothetical protein
LQFSYTRWRYGTQNLRGSVTVKRQSIPAALPPVARSGLCAALLAMLTALAGCSSLEMPKLRWPFGAKPAPMPEVVDEIVFAAADPGAPVSAFPQYFRRNTLIVDLTMASGQGSVVMRPKTAAGWPVRIAFRVKPGSFEALEVLGGQRLLLPVVGASQRPTLDLELPPSFVPVRTDAALTLRWGAVTAPPAVQSPPTS